MKFFYSFILFYFSFNLVAQNQNVTGSVFDTDKNPIQGVSVIDKKTGKWAIK